jgi:3-oxoacyl-[acyl-carrier protein] reductase
MDLGLAGRVAIVGGGSKGIGRAVAEMLVAEGARVVIAARGEPEIEAAAREIAATRGAEVMAMSCDMAKRDEIEALVEKTVERFRGIDIVVNNAGGPPFGRFEQHEDAAWLAALGQNLMSVVRMTRAALPYLRRSEQARIINITSTSVKEPIDGLILSNTARLGTTGLAKTLSRELGPDGITVNNVGPGSTLTDRIRPGIEAQARASDKSFDEALQERAQAIPVGRVGTPEDVAAVVVFLASKQARQVTGQTILVDGGATRAVL